MSKKQDQLLDHDYDGIREYDNDLPSWWLNLFYLSIVFSFVYMLHYHVMGTGDSQTVKYMKTIDENYERLPEDQGASLVSMMFATYKSPYYSPRSDLTQAAIYDELGLEKLAQEEIVLEDIDPLTDQASLDAGKAVFTQYCFSCHGTAGEGGIGPNLTDDYWLHGGSFPEIVYIIKKGVPIKGMIAWERSLKPDDLMNVASYVNSLLGTTPPNAKAPQGELYAAQ